MAGLEKARESAAKAINALDRHHCVRVEDFAGTSVTPIEACLEQLKTCQVYVGILGELYDCSPTGNTKSYTQIEFEEAGILGLPRLVFLTSEELLNTVGECPLDRRN